MTIPLTWHFEIEAREKAEWEATLAGLTSLERVLAWGRAQEPKLVIDEILTQDEYTHDVIMAGTRGRYLVFDTT